MQTLFTNFHLINDVTQCAKIVLRLPYHPMMTWARCNPLSFGRSAANYDSAGVPFLLVTYCVCPLVYASSLGDEDHLSERTAIAGGGGVAPSRGPAPGNSGPSADGSGASVRPPHQDAVLPSRQMSPGSHVRVLTSHRLLRLP